MKAKTNLSKRVVVAMVCLLALVLAVVSCVTPTPSPMAPVVQTVVVPQTVVVSQTSTPPAAKSLNVWGIFATPKEEPWDQVVDAALKNAQTKGQITYRFVENLGYNGDLERELRRIAKDEKPDLIVGDAFGNEEAVRRVAKDFPKIAFVFGSGLGPSVPNLSTFDNWIHEGAYLSGMVAGGMTKTGVIGVVAAMPIPEVNRLVNAFTAGAKEINPKVKVRTIFINSFFDLAKSRESATALVSSGADVLYAERAGVIEVAKEKGLWAFGNMTDQNSIAPNTVLTGPVWSLDPTIQYVIAQLRAGSYVSMELKDFNMMAAGGTTLAQFHGLDAKIPPGLVAKVKQREQEIMAGLFRVDINEAPPVSD